MPAKRRNEETNQSIDQSAQEDCAREGGRRGEGVSGMSKGLMTEGIPGAARSVQCPQNALAGEE